MKYCWRYAITGVIVFFLVMVALRLTEKGILSADQGSTIITFSYNYLSWLWSLALIGIFLRYFQTQNAIFKYLSDSSYWVYLVHIVGTMDFGLLLYDTTMSLSLKMFLNIVLTSAISLISYHFLVRNTWVGLLLNGRKHLRPKKDNFDDPASCGKSD